MQSRPEFGNGLLQGGLEDRLKELVKIRASQINACAFCLHVHTAKARQKGETEERPACMELPVLSGPDDEGPS